MVYVFELAEIEDSNIFEGKTSSAAFLVMVLEVKKVLSLQHVLLNRNDDPIFGQLCEKGILSSSLEAYR